jgi:hypothetical protein
MTRVGIIFLFAVGFLNLAPADASAQQSGKLYAPAKYRNEPVAFCLNFKTGLTSSMREPCDLRYGFLGINYDFDWLQASASNNSRSIFKDLGPRTWDESFDVPAVAALPKLQPGEQRMISIDASGANGRNGAPGKRGEPARSASGTAPPEQPGRVIWSTDFPDGSPPVVAQPAPGRPPKVDPIFLKAIAGHMYVAHIVDDNSDFYALFRIDALADQVCSISWKLIPTPKQ